MTLIWIGTWKLTAPRSIRNVTDTARLPRTASMRATLILNLLTGSLADERNFGNECIQRAQLLTPEPKDGSEALEIGWARVANCVLPCEATLFPAYDRLAVLDRRQGCSGQVDAVSLHMARQLIARQARATDNRRGLGAPKKACFVDIRIVNKLAK